MGISMQSEYNHKLNRSTIFSCNRISKRWIIAVCLVFFLPIFLNICMARLFFTGPNPFFSSASFPQDGLLFKGSGSFALFDYHPRGWYGDLDDPTNLPNADYSLTSQTLHLSNPTSEFNLRGNWTQYKASLVPYYFQYKGFHIQSLFSYELEDLYMNANGIARSQDDTLGWEQVPFEALVERQNTEYGLGLAIAKQLGNIPFGIRINADRKDWGEPYGYLIKTVDGNQKTLNRYTWGWTSQHPCNHILAAQGNIDAYYQDDYSIGHSSLINTVVGATINEHKFALRYRHFTQYTDEYEYDEDNDIYVREDEWTEKTNEHLLRGYGLFKLWTIGETNVHVLGFAEMDRSWIYYVGGGEQRFDKTYNKKTDFEIIPVVSIPLSKGKGFVRAGFDILWGWTGSSTTTLWGDQRVYRESYPYVGWSRDWNKPGYSHGFVLTNLTEVDMEYPIFKNPEIIVRLELWRMYQITWNTSHYGENENNNGIFVFQDNALREDKRKETWMSGLIGFWAGFGTMFSGIFIDLPITYHADLTTKVRDTDEGTVFSDNQNSFPAVQDPSRIRIIIGKRW